MRFSYKPIVQRFDIPRPTLIEWKKRAKKEPNNWRVKHLEYLQNQVILEEETIKELSKLSINYEEIFLFSAAIYMCPIKNFLPKQQFKKALKDFAYTIHDSVEFRHDFAKDIWSIKLNDGSDRRIADYYRVFDLLEQLNAFQYFVLFNKIVNFVNNVRLKIDIGYSDGFVGKTWQELYSLQKEFSRNSIEEKFSDILVR